MLPPSAKQTSSSHIRRNRIFSAILNVRNLLVLIVCVQQLEGHNPTQVPNVGLTEEEERLLDLEEESVDEDDADEDDDGDNSDGEGDELDEEEDVEDSSDDDEEDGDEESYEEDNRIDAEVDKKKPKKTIGSQKAIGNTAGTQNAWLPKIYEMFKSKLNFGKNSVQKETPKPKHKEDKDYLDDEDFLTNDEEDADLGKSETSIITMENALSKTFNNIGNLTMLNKKTGSDQFQGRQFFPMPMYMLQGIYLVEPRLNPYIDGVLRNLGSEIKVSGTDPLHFRVLPKGRVAPRRVSPAILNRRRQKHRRRKPKRRQRGRRRRRRGQQKRGKFGRGNVGLGRVDGLSKLVRDGSTEMQSQTADGNYTLVRSHFNVGPLDLTMQFKTVRGIRRAATTIHKVRIHTVTRVSNDGSEMMDFFLDRPHPESIQVRGRLFPMAQRVAKNIFSRLFGNNSFLVARIREKTNMALLSKPTTNSG